MIRLLAALLLVFSVVLADAPRQIRPPKPLPLDGLPGVTLKNRTNSQYLPDRVIVKLMPRVPTSLSKSAFGVRSIDQALARVSIVSVAPMFPLPALKQKPVSVDLSLIYEIRFSSPNDPFSLAEELSRVSEVQYAEPSFIYTVTGRTFTPNDPLLSSQWGLEKISAPAAWDISQGQGDSSIVIGIVDSGVDWSHPDLAANICTNPGEVGLDGLGGDKSTNGVDDDNNGYVDDYHGWDFAGADWRTLNEDNNPAPTGDNNNHGTHVAGIAAATTNNGIGIASIGFKCRILPVKCAADNDTRANGSGYIINGYRGITYAVDMGVKVVNCSWGGEGGSQFEQDIVNYATEHGTLVVASAGNNNADVFFSPAGYKGVLAIAATGPGDAKSGFSNFGDFVDVAAPGEDILSTGIHTTFYATTGYLGYTILSGTSMASPLAAGLAALVRWKFPYLTSLQAGEQVRVTSDPVSSPYQLGRGRLNALNALTIENLPSVRLQSFVVNDFPGGNGNGTAQPAETLNIQCVVKNFLSPTSPGSMLQLTTPSPYIIVIEGSFALGSLRTLDSSSNSTHPFRVYVNPTVPQSYTATMRLTFTDGSFTDTETFSFLVNPTYQTTAINDIQLTLTNDGRLGFFDYPKNSEGVGFVFNGANHLFEGGLIIATSSTRVVNVVRNGVTTGSQDGDFFSANFFTLTTPGIVSNQDGFTTFTDTTAPLENLIGVQVDAHSYAFSDPLDSKYIILRYDVTNRGTAPVRNAYIGIFLDWDLGNYDANISAFDSTRSLGYCYDASNTRREYVGIRALDSAAAFTSLVNDGSIDLSRAAKWRWVSGGFANAQAGPADIHHVISSGPFTINPGERHITGFALVAGDSSLANLQENADAAKAKWGVILKVVSVEDQLSMQPKEFRLEQNFPNPFNPSTTLEFAVPTSRLVLIKVYDVLGREIATLVNEVLQPGIHRARWNAAGFPSGVYFFRMQVRQISDGKAGGFVATRKALLMK